MAKKDITKSIMPIAGAAGGFALGGPAGAGLGMAAGGMLGNLFGDDGSEDVLNELRQNRARLDAIGLPDLQWKDYAPELYSNETANYELAQDDPIVRSMQLSALQRMSGLADQGLSAEDAAAFDKARDTGSQMARANTEAAIADANRRGVGGSGMEFAMREIANQGGAERAQNAGLEQAAASARQRALYNQAYMQGLGSMRSQDQNTAQSNADVINRFNMANTQNRNNTNMQNTQLRNQAQLTNNQGKNDTAQQNFNNAITRATGQNNAGNAMANAYAAQGAANTAQNNQFINTGAQMAMYGYGQNRKQQNPNGRVSAFNNPDEWQT